MLFRTKDLEAIFNGQCTLAFRRWKKPTVKPGGTVRTQLGMVGIDSVEPIEPHEVTELEARAAGYKDRAGVIAMFDAQEGTCYRIRLHPAGPDPREALRDAEPDAAELKALAARLQKLDKAAPAPWTRQALQLIADHPGVVSASLAETAGMERADFKLNIRKLKALGLTISLEVGYRLSPRGVALLATL
jgi:biotin operon repressor